LFHLGLLISSSFVLRSASSPALLLFSKQGPRGLARGPWTKLFPIPSSALPSRATARIRRNYG
jgi:hypothetical protein